jgi:hypothetical protein
VKKASVQRDEVDNQLTSVTLQKDALFDEVNHVRKEMVEIRTHLDRVCEENSQLNKHRFQFISQFHFAETFQLSESQFLLKKNSDRLNISLQEVDTIKTNEIPSHKQRQRLIIEYLQRQIYFMFFAEEISN